MNEDNDFIVLIYQLIKNEFKWRQLFRLLTQVLVSDAFALLANWHILKKLES